MIPYRQDPEHIAPANQAPRCQHVHATGRRCGSPALRGETFCYFHERTHSTRNWTSSIAFIEDATSLQCAIMKVIELLRGGHAEHKECSLLIRSLRLACMNLKGFAAERAEREALGSEEKSGKHRPGNHSAKLLEMAPGEKTASESTII